MTTRGKVLKVTGFEAVMKEALKDNPAWEMMKGIFSDEAMADKIQAAGGEFPEAAVKVGESWKHSGRINLGMMGSLTIAGTYTLKAVDPAGQRRGARVGRPPLVRGPRIDGAAAMCRRATP